MIKTKTKKAIAIAAIAGLSATGIAGFSASNVFATQIGTGTITSSGSYSSVINWNDTFSAAAASGAIDSVKVKARILPTLNLEVSADELDLGDLIAGTTSTGAVSLEVGTNAVDGVNITARSQNAGMANTSSGAIKISSTHADQALDSYTFVSSATATDSTFTGMDNDDFDTTGTGEVLSTSEINVYKTTKPEPKTGVNDVVFTVGANPNAQTPAGDYEDFVRFTVTGNF